jgi:hypothetical protein
MTETERKAAQKLLDRIPEGATALYVWYIEARQLFRAMLEAREKGPQR